MPRQCNYYNEIKNDGGKQVMNQFCGIGRLTKDNELQNVGDSKKMVNSVAINEGKDKDGNEITTFLDIEAWNGVAEYLCTYTQKGSRIGFNGQIKVDKWTTPDGTTKSKYYVRVNKAMIIDFVNTEEPKKSVAEAMKNAKKPLPITDSDVSEDMLPF